MSLCTVISGRVLCGATAPRSSSPQWSTASGGRVLGAHGQQQRGLMIYTISGLGSQVAKFTLGHAGGLRQICAGAVKDCSDRCARVKLPKSRVRFRVRCQFARGGSYVTVEDWTKKLPAKRKALYSHSLPCIEAWLQSLGFIQGKEDRAMWNIERPDWHAQLSLDVTDLYIRYLKGSRDS